MAEHTQNRATIFALSSAPGRAGVAVIRVSGPKVRDVLTRMAPPMPAPNEAAFRTIRHPATREPLDKAVVLFFAGPKSETGEDVAEFQVHGGRAVVAAVLEALATLQGCRMAEPGEFVRRAFEAGKLDLAEVEGLADLVDAETEAQRRQALAQSSGALSRLYEGWRSELLSAMAYLEAALDFSDEADVSDQSVAHAQTIVANLIPTLTSHLADGRRGEILRDGFRVAILGAPNAGKSSLLNALARRDAAIVSEEAGTTRDVIDVRLDLGGLPVVVSDTAGVRATEGAVEREGIRRSLRAASEADLVLWLFEPGHEDPPAEVSREILDSALKVQTKVDLIGPVQVTRPADLAISTKTGQGVEDLVRRLTEIAAARLGDTPARDAGPPLTRMRHRAALDACREVLVDLKSADWSATELRAEDVRRAAHALGRITGRVDVEDVLGEIFGRFCIGK